MSRESIPEENLSNSRGSEFASSSQDNSLIDNNNNMETPSHHIYDNSCINLEHTSFEPIINNNYNNFLSINYNNNQSSPQTCFTYETTQPGFLLREMYNDYTTNTNPNINLPNKSRSEVSPEQKSRAAQASQLSRIRRRLREQRLDEDNRNLKETVQQFEKQNHHLEQEISQHQYQNGLTRQSLNTLNQSQQLDLYNSSFYNLYHQRQTLDHQMLILQHQINQMESDVTSLQPPESSSNIIKKSPSLE